MLLLRRVSSAVVSTTPSFGSWAPSASSVQSIFISNDGDANQRRHFAAEPAKPAGGAAAKPAPPKGGGGGGGKPGAKGKKERAVSAPKVVIKYGHGGEDRPLRQTVRVAERTARLQSHEESGRLPTTTSTTATTTTTPTTGAIGALAQDPVLQAMARRESGSQLVNPPTAADDTTFAKLEEPHEVASYVFTKARAPAFDAALPEALRGASRIALVPTNDVYEAATDHSDNEASPFSAGRFDGGRGGGGRGGGGSGGGGAAASFSYIGRDKTSTSSSSGIKIMLPVLPGEAANEAQASEMAEALLRKPQTQAQLAAAKARGPVATILSSTTTAADAASRMLFDAEGNKRTPGQVAGVEDARIEAWWRRHTHGLEDTDSELEVARRAFHDPEERRQLSGVWGADPAKIPQGILEELAAPYDLYGHEAEEPTSQAVTEREAAMTPEEKIINQQRRKLQELIERPMPVTTRPLWPLYGLMAGVDQVQQVVKGGMIASTRCMVVVGNGQGGVGFGMAKHKEPFSATKQALQNAQRDMIHVATHRGSLYHDMIGKKNNVYVIIRSLPASSPLLNAAPLIHDIFELAGIKRASAKIVGSHRRSPYVVVQALFDAFNHHYPPQAEAYMRGLRAVQTSADRINPRTVYPFSSRGPRHEAANTRVIKGSLRG